MKQWIKYVISAAIAVLLLYYSFKGVKWDSFIDGIRSCRWEWVIVSMIAGVFVFWLRAVRWRLLLLPVDKTVSCKTTFNAINIGYLTNLALPRIGEFVRCGFITRHSTDGAASYDKVLGTVIIERSWDVITMFLLVILLSICMWSRFGSFFMDKIFRPMSGSVDISLFWILLTTAVLLAAAILLIFKFRDSNKILRSVYRFIAGIWQGAISCFKMKDTWKFLATTAAIWGTYWIMSCCILWAVQGIDTASADSGLATAIGQLPSLGILDALFLMLAGSLSSLVPVPGGFGAFHYVVASALAAVYGIPWEAGIIFATLSHESQTVTMLICGGCSYAAEVTK